MQVQRTLREKIQVKGIGLHSGRHVALTLLPAPADSGISFVRADLPAHPQLRPCLEHLVDTTLATTLGVGSGSERVTVGTVEHLLAALTGMGVDNVQALVDGPEVPILDGSAAPFVDLIAAAGLEAQRRSRRGLVIRREVRVRDGLKEAAIAPAPRLSITCTLDFDHPLISPAPFVYTHAQEDFARALARARTFGFLADVEALRARGLARGGSLDNAVVIDGYQVLNQEGLRYPDEFVRHKVLDALGDLSLFGAPVLGRVSLHRTGHALNARLVAAVLADRRAHEYVESTAAISPQRGDGPLPLEGFEAVNRFA